MAVKKYRLVSGNFYYHDNKGAMIKGEIGQIFEREEQYVSLDQFELVDENVSKPEPAVENQEETEDEPEKRSKRRKLFTAEE